MHDVSICGTAAPLTTAFLNHLDADTLDEGVHWWCQREELDDERVESGIPSIHR